MTRNNSENNILEWTRQISTKKPKLCIFLKFTLLTGLRYIEAVNSYNLIIKLKREGKLSEYYNYKQGDLGVLQVQKDVHSQNQKSVHKHNSQMDS
jgi:hypothetical protein